MDFNMLHKSIKKSWDYFMSAGHRFKINLD